MAPFENYTDLGDAAGPPTASSIIRTTNPPPVFIPPFFRQTTLSPGHEAILEMHANSSANAIIYVLIVLAIYVLAMTLVIIKYVRSERYEARLTRLFHNLMQRDRFFRLSRRRSSLPKCVPTINGNDLELSPTNPIPEISATLYTSDTNDDIQEESKV
ncbi:uncharacterized protein [Parasteatoda tepidariorum]|uniref:Uncharacterized protein n=1 Tax=Parasteatoda tepidariorum TaxID=114398 RepID=A0A2L2YLA0_PARTP|nr:uncharacterized protein LOC107438320 [Parasteatoda tepidariorum]